ncbi:MAG: ADP/ATP carrier protein [Trizodia sp. TS-e1964]|nr:MAG: ADP/ATP carrier protein [Trizodia sp. TS-e1964]
MSRKPNLELLPPWGSAVAGATGAILANAAVYPLDIVKTRLQVQVKSKPEDILSTVDSEPYYTSTSDAIAKIISEEGLGGLYSGIHGSLIGVASTNFAYFYWYTTLRNLYTSSQKNMRPPSASAELALGALAGAIAQIFTIPVSVVTTRQQTQSKGQKKGLFETGKEVIESEDGYSGLWRGLRASLVLVVNPAITYGAYQRLNNLLFQGKSRLRPWESFFLGAVSKACATVLTQPLIVAKVGLQSKPPPSRGDRPFQTFIEVMRYIVQREGLLGLFKGIGPQIMKGVIVQGLLMMTKDRCVKVAQN